MGHSILPWVNRLKIVTKDLHVVSLGEVMNYAQLEVVRTVDEALADRRRCRFIVLKARQIGISTIIEALMFSMAMLLDRMRGLVVAHETEASQHLLEITDHYWKTWPFRDLYTAKHQSIKRLGWADTESTIRIATARNIGAGRSQTIHFLHASEAAFWDDPRGLMTGLAQSIPNTSPSLIGVESTANGVGNWFYEQWYAAEAGDIEYTPLFFPWWKHPQYTAEGIQADSLYLGPLDTEERALKALGLDDSRLVWRRYALRDLCQNDLLKLHQEYPTTPQEAFVATGNNVFPDEALQLVYQPIDGLRGRLVEEAAGAVRFQPAADGPLTIFKHPGPVDVSRYVVAGDPIKFSGQTGDFACAQVINRRTWEQAAVWHGRIDPVTFGEQMVLLGKFYNWAILCPEVQGSGDSTIARILMSNYPYVFEHQKADRMPGTPDKTFGFWSTTRSKMEAVGNLIKVVVDHDIVLHDARTFTEMRGFVNKEGGRFGNSSETGHDDTVSALAIAMTVIFYEMTNAVAPGPPAVDGQPKPLVPIGTTPGGGMAYRDPERASEAGEALRAAMGAYNHPETEDY